MHGAEAVSCTSLQNLLRQKDAELKQANAELEERGKLLYKTKVGPRQGCTCTGSGSCCSSMSCCPANSAALSGPAPATGIHAKEKVAASVHSWVAGNSVTRCGPTSGHAA